MTNQEKLELYKSIFQVRTDIYPQFKKRKKFYEKEFGIDTSA